VLLGFDRQGWITVFAALLLALITLFTNYTHVDLWSHTTVWRAATALT
jgi:cytochrome c-type biogenesis protein CcmH/NrfG